MADVKLQSVLRSLLMRLQVISLAMNTMLGYERDDKRDTAYNLLDLPQEIATMTLLTKSSDPKSCLTPSCTHSPISCR